jgi:predicted RNase H-like nuclease (RuvC/YqgF family)|tara:strand:- start:357 stop:548 length:192 start_codon:yes stop_codon:yes gene_type:complete
MFKRIDYIRDTHSNAILKKDRNSLEQHRLRRKEISSKENEIHTLREDISELKKMVEELKVRIK